MTPHALPSYFTVLDAQALERLRTLDPGDANGLVDRVLGTFKNSLETLMPRLHEGQRAGDADAVRHVAHTLKSSSSSVGALRLSGLCAAVEATLRDGGELASIARQLDELQAESRRLIAVLPALAPRSR